MSERVAACRLRNARPADGLFNRALKDRFRKVMTPPLAATRLDMDSGCRENPLPDSFAGGIRILPG
jgi:hypothetical protein